MLVESLKTRVEAIDTRLSEGLGALNTRVSDLNTRVSDGLGALDTRVSDLSTRVDETNKRLLSVDDSLHGVHAALVQLTARSQAAEPPAPPKKPAA